jgi:hypothetical protein
MMPDILVFQSSCAESGRENKEERLRGGGDDMLDLVEHLLSSQDSKTDGWDHQDTTHAKNATGYNMRENMEETGMKHEAGRNIDHFPDSAGNISGGQGSMSVAAL